WIFLYWSAAPRSLHSFPTRRSSDLRFLPRRFVGRRSPSKPEYRRAKEVSLLQDWHGTTLSAQASSRTTRCASVQQSASGVNQKSSRLRKGHSMPCPQERRAALPPWRAAVLACRTE